MYADPIGSSARTEAFVARLTDTALTVISRHAVRAPSVEVELGIWHALRAAYRLARRCPERLSRRHLLDALAAAAYRAALRYRPAGSFLDLELGLWRAFHTDGQAIKVGIPA